MDNYAPFAEEEEFVIESGVPMPPGRARYPFDGMEVGDSFGFATARVKLVRSAAQAYAKRHAGYDFELREMPATPEPPRYPWRCWRMA